MGADASGETPIYVGSIKTVIGHLEGCAGLAGVIKVLLAIKNRTIPPNLLFNELNPAITPFYGPLKIPTTAIPWPKLPAEVPARASVNSFGFGGTNAHAIIESYDDGRSVQEHNATEPGPGEGVLGPLIFSTGSGGSLLRTVQAYLEHLRHHPSLDIRDLAWLFQTRRSTNRVRAHFSGPTREAIMESMATFITEKNKLTKTSDIGYQSQLINPSEVPGILGIFTGQGAQWATMGRGLTSKSPIFRRTIQKCESVLQALPTSDAPEWSLVQELAADTSSSRLSEAALSQPLCTAVQIALIDLLRAAGIDFDAVVGHSSGEIAATYASGIITLKGAMQIAYYRGFYARLATGINGQSGGMLAAGMSLEKARQFCRLPEFEGRIQVAASNAPNSVTLSGDIEAILAAKQQLDNEKMFARQLKVDTAYHSQHMQPCAKPYLESLLACDIEIRQPRLGKCVWSSSVRGDAQLVKGDLSALKGPYWVANMVKPVLFSQAMESSIWHGGPFDLAIEIGPHPALKGPTEQTLRAATGSVPLYTGTLNRGSDDVQAISEAVGITWAQLGPSSVDFEGYRKAFYDSQPPAPRIIKDLPTYSWDHKEIYWRESRLSRRYRTGKDVAHELLGRRTLDDNDHELRWRNVLKLSEMSWLRGHEVLEEVLLPGAAYVSIAVQAGMHIARKSGRFVRLLEVEDVDILRPLVVPDNQDGVETLFTARLLKGSTNEDDVLRAHFAYYVCNDQLQGSMIHTCSGKLLVHLDNKSEFGESLPLRDPLSPNMIDVDTGPIYSMFEDIGLNYSGVFRSLRDSKRCLGHASSMGVWPEGSLSDNYVVHPAILDVAFQTLIIARAHPASGQISSALLPSHIDRVLVNPSAQIIQPESTGQIRTDFESWVVTQTGSSLKGDLSAYNVESGKTFLQVEGLDTRMVGAEGASKDRQLFAKTAWGKDISLGLMTEPVRDSAKDGKLQCLTEALERAALFYVKRLVQEIGTQDRSEFQWYHQRMLEAFEEHLAMVKNGQHPVLQGHWLIDDLPILQEIDAEHPDSIELQMIHAVGNNLAGVVRG